MVLYILYYYLSLRSYFRVMMSVAIFPKKMFGSSLSSVVCRMTHVLLVRSYVFTFLILSGEILYDFGIQAMFGSSCLWGADFVFMLFVQHVLTIRAT
jgi:hypothetical protein